MALGSGRTADNYYCSRRLGVTVIPGSDGQCGPSNGPQCPDCKGFTRGADPAIRSRRHGHPLSLVGDSRRRSAYCDVCRASGSCAYFCDACNWDICYSCLGSESAGGESGPVGGGSAAGSSRVIESRHPYPDDADDYTVVAMAGATGYTVTFDDRSSTEKGYDYIRYS